MNKLCRAVYFFIYCLLFAACGEYENLEIEKDARRVSDSLFRAHRDSLTKSMDSLCLAQKDSLFNYYFDSLKIVEAEKIRELLDR